MIAPPRIQRTFVLTRRVLGASSGALANPHVRLLGRRRPTPGAVGPGPGRARSCTARSFLGLIHAFLELLETRPKRSGELRESVRAEQTNTMTRITSSS